MENKSVTWIVEGKVTSHTRAGVSGLRVVIVDKNIGEDLNLAETLTDDHGKYRASFTSGDLSQRGKQQPDLQARLFAGQRFLQASAVRYNASPHEKLNILLSEKASTALPAEYETLTCDVARHFKGRLGDLKEMEEQRDITYLANKTGWDARAVALAALADQFSQRSKQKIPPPFFYALFRAGLPANGSAIYHADIKTVEAIWRQAIKQGVIPAELKEQVPQAAAQFSKLAVQHTLDDPARIGLSSMKEMLTISLGSDRNKHKQFADLYARHQGDRPKFWEAVRSTFGDAAEKRLRLDGQLAYLTLNNASLIGKLHAAAGSNSLHTPLDLVEQGYYRAAAWRAAIGEDRVPAEIPGKDDAEKRSRYAELLAAQVRLSYPTAVVAQMVKNEETRVGKDLTGKVHAFLMAHQGTFEIGIQPVEQYVARSGIQGVEEEVREITRIQRVYQITPGDDAMNVLLKNDIDSAYKIVNYGRDPFIQAFKKDLGEHEARLTYAKAEQVHNAVLNIATAFLTAKIAPGIGLHSPARYVNPEPHPPANASDVIAYATLEGLFGEMDYCTCEHCRSVLSPAAYLVDLLAFLDRDLQAWRQTLSDWKASHEGAPYPFESWTARRDWEDAHPGEVADTEQTPLQILLDRRPDIESLPLTCENTNTPLPYIDLVNETLEYFIANQVQKLSLQGYTGHDTDGAAAEDLLATPQSFNDSIRDDAYNLLKGEYFPGPLPFHQPLENLRRYFARFEVPLPQAMERLLISPVMGDDAPPYGWQDIWLEELALSRAEQHILTDSNTAPLVKLYGFPTETDHATIIKELENAKKFTRRVGITYEELIAILKTRFINPNAVLIPKFERLGVPLNKLTELKDGEITNADFEDDLPDGLDSARYDGDIPGWVIDHYDDFMRLVSIADLTPEDGIYSFDKLVLRYANPDNHLNAIEFVKLIRFIRLWKKLGWTIEQTDEAITALYPPEQVPDWRVNYENNVDRLNAGFLVLLPRLGVIKRVIKLLKLQVDKDLLSLLACFAPINTQGTGSLYRQMFTPALQKLAAPFADNGYGEYLTGEDVTLFDHEETLRAAFQLTGEEFAETAAHLQYTSDMPLANTPTYEALEELLGRPPSDIERLILTSLRRTEFISAIFRPGWLARKLKLSVRELLLLKQVTGIDPFAMPDMIDPPILKFLALVDRLQKASLKPVEALYLIWNQDISGKSSPGIEEMAQFARTLRSGLTAIESEFALVDDPDGQIARTRMALVYGSETAELFFALLDKKFISEITYRHSQPTLEEHTLRAAAPGQIAYDDYRKRLSFRGLMTPAIRDALKVGAPLEFEAAVDQLYDANQKVLGPFFVRYPVLLNLYDDYFSSAEPDEQKRAALLANFLPQLKRRRKRQQALQTISAAAKADFTLSGVLLEDAAVLHSAGNPAAPALDDLTAMEAVGLSAAFYYHSTATGEADLLSPAEANLDYSASGENLLPPNTDDPAASISGVWEGYLEAPENDLYYLRIEAEEGAVVTLTLDNALLALEPGGIGWQESGPFEWRAGKLYHIRLQVENIRETMRLQWQTTGRGWEMIPSRYIYSTALMGNLSAAYVRFLKAVSLSAALRLTANETSHFASNSDYQIEGQGWLNSLPVAGSSDSPELLKVLNALLDFACIKAALSPEDERLLAVIQNPIAAAQAADAPLYALTRWEPGSLKSLLAHFGNKEVAELDDLDTFNQAIAELAHLDTFHQVYAAYQLVKTLGIPASALIRAVTNEPDAGTVRDLQSALRARYTESSWRSVLQPINDELRALQRDALVAYILHQMSLSPESEHIDTPDKLFEYFLMDVQMEPVLQTSRVRHALSSVQLFITRCLMGLEPWVAPSTLDAKQWEWMKRYRIWEANRNVFLYPENWLEPELRDDQSPFFKEAMDELLQGDITEDRAAKTLLNYLSKLDEVAKLEPCGMFYEEPASGVDNGVVHVVARTAGANRKYYYRRRDSSGWSPWEQIKLDIEDNPIIPVIWNGRLFLFWLRILKQAPLTIPVPPQTEEHLANVDPSQVISTTSQKIVVRAMLCWSEYYNGKWQPTRTSDVNQALKIGEFLLDGFDRSTLVLEAVESDGLHILINGDENVSFLLYNTHSLPVPESSYDIQSILEAVTSRDQGRGVSKGNILSISYYNNWESLEEGSPTQQKLLLISSINARILESFPGWSSWYAPFFYENSRHVFYVTTTDRLVTIPEWMGYALAPSIALLYRNQMPPLVVCAEPPPRPPAEEPGPIVDTPWKRMTDPAWTARFVSEDAYINKGIGIAGAVRYGESIVGPAGARDGIVQH